MCVILAMAGTVSKARLWLDVSNLLKTSFYTLRPRLSAACVSRCPSNASRFDKKSLLPCASLHSLPGNRFQTLSHLPHTPANSRSESTRVPDNSVSWSLGVAGIEELGDFTPLNDKTLQQDVAEKISTSVEQGEHGRLYAVVYIRAMQYKVTPGDIIVVKHDFPPDVGDKIRLEKVLAVGGADFSLFGQPLLSRSKVCVEATVMEKTLSHNRVWFVFQKRKSFQKFHVYQERHTMLVINSVQVLNASQESPAQPIVDKHQDVLT